MGNDLMHLYFDRTHFHVCLNAGCEDIYRTEEFPDWTVAFFGSMILTFVLPYNIISNNTAKSLILYHI